MPDDTDLLRIRQEIYADGLDVCYTDNCILIGKLLGGSQRYLHKLFLPIDNAVNEVEKILGFPIPGSYAYFFSFSDGATLFDNTLFVYGVRSSLTREASIDNIWPVSLRENVDVQRRIRCILDWTEVGALAAATKSYTIEINRLGVAALCDPDGQRRECGTFLLMLLTLVKILRKNCGPHGLIDPSAETLQAEIDGFVRASRQ